MNQAGKSFLAALHALHMKPRGYTKVRGTFSKSGVGYVNRIMIQGSAWNTDAEKCRFYINCGMEFSDLPPRVPARDFPGTHCWARSDVIMPGTPSEFDYEIGHSDFILEVATLISKVSSIVERRWPQYREDYLRTASPWITGT